MIIALVIALLAMLLTSCGVTVVRRVDTYGATYDMLRVYLLQEQSIPDLEIGPDSMHPSGYESDTAGEAVGRAAKAVVLIKPRLTTSPVFPRLMAT